MMNLDEILVQLNNVWKEIKYKYDLTYEIWKLTSFAYFFSFM